MKDLLNNLIFYSDSKDFFKVETHDDMFDTLRKIIKLADEHGFSGNLWHSYVAYYIATAENSYTFAQERKCIGAAGSLDKIAANDCKILKSIFEIDLKVFVKYLDVNLFEIIKNYDNMNIVQSDLGKKVDALKKQLEESKSDMDFFQSVQKFYSENGAGIIGLSKAFVLEESANLKPIKVTDTISLDDLIGYETQKERLVANTKAFVEGRPANNVLLYGDGGTGKSTSVRAVSNQFYGDGLRIIQVYRHQMQHLNELITKLKNRNYKFIIYMDDLSFEDFETEYKYLKAVIEGGLEPRPDNVLIYATSNRRHLIRETWKDRNDFEQDGDMHRSDSIEEKLSLAERFGIQIYYGKPTKDEFHKMVEALVLREGVNVTIETLHREATKWEIRHGGVSGRSARQLVDYLKGMEDSI